MQEEYGPKTRFAQEQHAQKYRGKGESFKEGCTRQANALADNSDHFEAYRDALLNQRFLPGGRIQSAAGSPRKATCYNCVVSGTIEDSMQSILEKAAEAGISMKYGAGIGYDFSTIRPKNDKIRTIDSSASGAVSFMHIFDAVCKTVASAGNRRGAQMGVLRVDHPDIEEFIEAKRNQDSLTQFNISVAVTDEFMRAVEKGKDFDLVFDGRVYETVNARHLFEKIMRINWDWAEPGVLFIDRINDMNNLYFCEQIAATNPCGEQPLPPYGACLLGSFNLTKYIVGKESNAQAFLHSFDWEQFKTDIPVAVSYTHLTLPTNREV